LNSFLEYRFFVSYDIINRSDKSYNDIFLGQWIDFDLGNAFDDFVGSDSNLHCYFAYNGDNYDSLGYGSNPPAVGVTFLNRDLSKFMYYNNDWSLNGNPDEGIHYYYYLTGRFKNGQGLRYGGDGFNSTWEDKSSNYMYPDDPSEPYPAWSEMTSGNTPAERRVIGSSGKYKINPGDTFRFDVAYVWARDKTKNHLENLDLLKTYIQEVRAFYNANPPTCRSLNYLGKKDITETTNIKIYPNPVTDYLYINSGKERMNEVELYSVDGKLLKSYLSENSKLKVNVSNLKSGFYQIVVKSESGIIKDSFIKQ